MPDLLSENKINLQWREKLLFAFVIPLLLWAGYYRKFYKPQQREMRRLDSSIVSMERKIREIKREEPELLLEERKMRQLKSEHIAIKEKVKSLQGGFFGKEEVPFIIKLLTERITPSMELIYMRAQPLKSEEFYEKFPIEISLISSFPESLAYIANIEKTCPFLKLNDFSVSSHEDTSLVNTRLTVNALLCERGGKIKSRQIAKDSADFSAVRDPFISPLTVEEGGIETPEGKKKAVKSLLKLQGIIWGEEKVRTAIINGKVLMSGDEIDGNKIVGIEKDRVILKKGDKEYPLMLEEGSVEN